MALPVSIRPLPRPGLPAVTLAAVDHRKAVGPRALLMLGSALAIGILFAPGIARADAELAKARNCLACHAIDKKLIGPSYKDVAAKYAGDRNAVEKLAKKIREGGVGTWGQIPMPANPQVSADEGTKLATWILNQK